MAHVHSSTGAPLRASSTPEININRRALVAGLAAAPIAALPVLAAGDHPDAELLRLYAEWRECADECDRRDRVLWDLEKKLEEIRPERPEACFARDDDALVGLLLLQHPHAPSGGQWYPSSSIEKMRKYNFARLHPSTQERVSEILENADRYEAAYEQAKNSLGFAAAEARKDEAYDRNRALRAAIAPLPASSLEGVIAKARIAEWCCGGPESMANDLAEDGSLTDEHFMRQAVGYLLRVAGGGLA